MRQTERAAEGFGSFNMAGDNAIGKGGEAAGAREGRGGPPTKICLRRSLQRLLSLATFILLIVPSHWLPHSLPIRRLPFPSVHIELREACG